MYNAELVRRVCRAVKNFEVNGPRVMVLRDDAEKESRGGIIIPDEAQRRKKTGTVVALGKGYEAVAKSLGVEDLTVGRRVGFNAYDGIDFAIDVEGELVEVLVMHAGNVYMNWDRANVKERDDEKA